MACCGLSIADMARPIPSCGDSLTFTLPSYGSGDRRAGALSVSLTGCDALKVTVAVLPDFRDCCVLHDKRLRDRIARRVSWGYVVAKRRHTANAKPRRDGLRASGISQSGSSDRRRAGGNQARRGRTGERDAEIVEAVLQGESMRTLRECTGFPTSRYRTLCAVILRYLCLIGAGQSARPKINGMRTNADSRGLAYEIRVPPFMGFYSQALASLRIGP